MELSLFEELFNRCIDGTASQAEREQLFNMVTDNKEKFDALVSERLFKLNADQDVSAATSEELLKTIFAAAYNSEPTKQLPARRLSFLNKTWFRYAAAVVIIAGAAMFFIDYPKEQSRITADQQPDKKKGQIDIEPGNNTALLTLADGSVIPIDSVPVGRIALQGGAVIIKSENGEIVYSVDNQGADGPPVYNTMSAPKGSQYKLTLPDGSLVWLNAASSITFPVVFTENDRSVHITGEVYFDVAKDKNKPFIVHVDNRLQVQVLGTRFDINAYSDEASINTTLIDGSVIVKNGSGETRLQPGEKAEVAANGNISLKNDVDVQEDIAWINGEFYFGDKADFGSVMRQIARWYDVEVEYKEKVTAQIGGSIPRNVNISLVLQMLEKAGGVKFEMQGKKIIVMP